MDVRHAIRNAGLTVFALLALAARAGAAPIPIGQVFIANDPFAGLGPVFTVENDSGVSSACDPADPAVCFPGDFTNVSTSLSGTTDAGTFSTTFSFASGADTIAPAGSVDSSALDLSDPSLVLSSAIFTLTFSGAGLVAIGPFTDFTDGSTQTIYFTPSTATPVPEPATLLLVSTGLSALLGTVRRKRLRALF